MIFFRGIKIFFDLIFSHFSQKSSEVWGKWGCRFDIQKCKLLEISMMVEISTKIFYGIFGRSLGLSETGFRIFISATVVSESAVDLVHLISQTEVILDFLNRFY